MVFLKFWKKFNFEFYNWTIFHHYFYELLQDWSKYIELYLRPIPKIADSDLDSYQVAADNLLVAWKKCELNKTFKIHWLTRHGPEFVRRNKFSIGFITEQGIEALHSIWTTYDKRYAAVDRVLAVLRWNRLHIDNKKLVKKFKNPGKYTKNPAKDSSTRLSRSKT